MKRITLGFAGLTIAAWLIGLWANPPALSGRELTHEVFYVNGVLALGLMAIAIVIAARPAWIERISGEPLDELYRSHRAIGFWAIGLSVFHIFTKTVMGPVLSLFTLEPSAKPVPGEAVTWFDVFWQQLRPFAVDSSWVVSAMGLVLAVMIFMPQVRYALWAKTHALFSAIYIILAVHAVRLMDMADLALPLGWINIACAVVGTWYSVKLLAVGAGREKTFAASVDSVEKHDGVTILTVKPAGNAPRFKGGQFAFLRAAGSEKHPFSVTQQLPDGRIVFSIKAFDGWTKRDVPNLKAGDPVELEGPWGAFCPDFNAREQVWVAAGIGIAPFCAWMESAAQNRAVAKGKNAEAPKIRLDWCIKSRETEPLLERAEALAKAAGVELRIFESKGVRLDPKTLFANDLPQKVALCAGAGLAGAVCSAYAAAGGRPEAIQREHFVWR